MSVLGSEIFKSTRTLKVPVSGPDVADLQSILNILHQGRQGTIPIVNGIFNYETAAAVRIFQQAMGIGVDGVFGKNSRTALASLWNAAAQGSKGVGGYGSGPLERLRTAQPENPTISVPASSGGGATRPPPSTGLTVIGPAVPSENTPSTPVTAMGIWAKLKAPVTLPLLGLDVPRWSLFAGGGLLFAGVVGVLGGKRR